MNNINCVLEQKNNCCGCRACANICPVSAITMQEDEEGFFYPVVDEIKCTNCGLCKKSCPSLNKSEVFNKNTKTPDCYAVMADDETRLVSSSGGAFSLIANWILEQGGYVCGVAFVGQKVQHIIIDNKNDLHKLRGSKYVQSDTNTVFSQIKDLLKNDKYILFTGTPCQVAGLYGFLRKDYEKLLTIDLFCHGVPPQKVFDMYLKEVTKGNFINTSFRDKITGWDVYTTTTTTEGVYSFDKNQCLFLNAFLKNMCLRPSCGICPYTSTQRESDITIGDFWAIKRFDKKLNDKMGTSAVLLNSPKGKKIFKAINNIKTLQKVPLEYATYYNWTLYRTLPQHPNRNAFFKLLNQGKSLSKTVDYCLKNKYDCALLGVWPYENYGSALTMFGLQEAIKGLGYIPKVINYHIVEKNRFAKSFSGKFASKYLNLTSYHYYYKTLYDLNKETQTFIVGSDCMWHPPFYNKLPKEYTHFLSFASADSKKIAYATSFGTYDYSFEANEKNRVKYYLDQFDKISIREQARINFCKEIFNLDVSENLDPVFLINKNIYKDIINDSNLKTEDKYIALCNFWPNLKINKFLNFVSDYKNLKTININDKEKYDVCDWLKLINNCELIITHSFHAMCFAIIFNKPFIVWKIPKFDEHRYSSLLKKFGLENRLLIDINTIENRSDLFEPIDWDRVNSILAKEKDRSLKWLKDALEAPKDLSKINPTDAIIQNLNNKIINLQYENQNKISIEGLVNLLNYNKNYRKYLKYKILKNVVFGSTRERYKKKQKIYHEKIRSARRIKRGIAGV